MEEGLDRHEAVHAIGSVLSEQLFAALREEAGADLNAQYVEKLNRVDGFMPVESFLHQSQKNGTCQKRISEGHLVLDDHVNSGVKSLVRKPDSIPPMVPPD